ncbi:MAG: leucyl aminopeptidase [Planctomycetaceae bacterium]
MQIESSTSPWNEMEADWLIVGVTESPEITGALGELDGKLGGRLARLKEIGDLAGKLAETRELRGVDGIAARRLLVVGLGKPEELTLPRIEKAMLTAARQISDKKRSCAVVVPSAARGYFTAGEAAKATAFAFRVGCVGQGLYRTEPNRFEFERLTLLIESTHEESVKEEIERGRILGEAVNLTRELVNRPPQEMYPESLAERARTLASQHGLDCEIFDEQRLRDERMGSLLAVAQGSDRPPRVVVLSYRGAGPDAPTLGLIGKGVTFDSGGLSLKPTDGMLTMKCDMAGAATVLGAMTAIAQLKPQVNVLGFMGLVENMVSGSSYKLGDVLTARNGVTIEVHNTDAEGRLVLADVLSYAVDRGVTKMIDLATLTGACVVALGEDVTGAMSNNQDWCDSVLAAAKKCGEDAWQLPMFELYSELIKSEVADIKNVGGRWGGAITAAKFLEKFVAGKPWVHLDIAGPSFAASSKPHREGGGTGCMVRTLVEIAASFGG